MINSNKKNQKYKQPKKMVKNIQQNLKTLLLKNNIL